MRSARSSPSVPIVPLLPSRGCERAEGRGRCASSLPHRTRTGSHGIQELWHPASDTFRFACSRCTPAGSTRLQSQQPRHCHRSENSRVKYGISPAGREAIAGNRVGGESSSWVRIPPSPLNLRHTSRITYAPAAARLAAWRNRSNLGPVRGPKSDSSRGADGCTPGGRRQPWPADRARHESERDLPVVARGPPASRASRRLRGRPHHPRRRGQDRRSDRGSRLEHRSDLTRAR